MLEGTTESKMSSVCLDNIHFMDNKTPELPVVCSPEEFACANGSCIDSALACDYQFDCLDGSDENSAACGKLIYLIQGNKQWCDKTFV